MSLNQKYTWHDFLKEHPEHKDKGTRRTSSEGKKAFDSAYKAFMKTYLSDRVGKVEKLVEKAQVKRGALQSKAKDLRKSGKAIKAKLVDKKIARTDSSIARQNRITDKTKSLQKSFK